MWFITTAKCINQEALQALSHGLVSRLKEHLSLESKIIALTIFHSEEKQINPRQYQSSVHNHFHSHISFNLFKY